MRLPGLELTFTPPGLSEGWIFFLVDARPWPSAASVRALPAHVVAEANI